MTPGTDRLAAVVVALLVVALLAFSCVRDAQAANPGDAFRVDVILAGAHSPSWERAPRAADVTCGPFGYPTDLAVAGRSLGLWSADVAQYRTPTGYVFKATGYRVRATRAAADSWHVRNTGKRAAMFSLYCEPV
jgi:hypothetical protein